MTAKYKHCYSNYVNHILNTSPSKITYSFAKGERFASPKKENNAPVDKVLQKNIHPDVAKKYNVELPLQVDLSPKNMINNYLKPQNQKQPTTKKKLTPNPKPDKNRSKSKSQNIENFPVDKHVGKDSKRTQQQKPHVTFQRSPKHSNRKPLKPQGESSRASDINLSGTQRRKVWQKGEDPYEKQRFPNNCLYTDPLYHYEPPEPPADYLPLRLLPEPPIFSDPYHLQYSKYPPYYPSYTGKNQQRLQQTLTKSRDKSSKKLNRSLSEIDKTKHHRLKTASDMLRQMDHPSKNITNHGYYPIGTEIKADGKYPLSTYKNVLTRSFGQPCDSKSASKGNVSNRKDKVKMKQGQIARGGSTANLPKSFESYTPFSEFGYVQPFKY